MRSIDKMEVFKIFKGLLSLRQDKTLIDNLVFRLHYRFTSILLLGCTILVSSHQFFGDPIDCIARNDVRPELLDRYCWVQKTFSLPKDWRGEVGTEVLYPGVANSDEKDVVYHAYYQWVCFVLLFQSILFYLPHYVWKALEGGRLKEISAKIPGPFSETKEIANNLHVVVRYVRKSTGTNLRYAISYVFCEVLNLVNVVGQMYLMDSFLGGEFFSYGFQVMTFSEWDQKIRYDPMSRRFPRVTKCTFHFFGSSGDVQTTDHMCLLSLNIVNEKVYLLLWFWFFALAAITFVNFVYRIVVIANVQDARYRSLSRPGFNGNKALRALCHDIPVGDYVLLNLLMTNVDRFSYEQFIKKMIEPLENCAPPTPNESDANGWNKQCKLDFGEHQSQHRGFKSTDM